MAVDRDACRARFDSNPAIVTALVPEIGYDAATELVVRLKMSGRSDVRSFLEEAVGREIVGRRLAPEALMRRIEWARGVGARTPAGSDPRAWADAVLGPMLTNPTRRLIAQAESPMEALSLALASPEFQRK